jgi:hypothetical protein
MISNLVKQKSDVHNKIKKASARPEVIEAAIEYFEAEVVTDLNRNLEDDVCTEIINALNADSTVPDKKREELTSLYHEGKIGEFLAMSFIYAIGKTNKQTKKKKADPGMPSLPGIDDIFFLSEVNNKCPICHNWLVKTIKGRTSQKYAIVKIYPDDLTSQKAQLFQEARRLAKKQDSNDNKIALCRNCAQDYLLDTELEEYMTLFDIKQQFAQSYRIQQELNDMVLEDDIKEVIHALGSIDHVDRLQELSLEVIQIKKKIRPENAILLDDLIRDALTYYRFVEDNFSQINVFNLIASEIQATFYKIEKNVPEQVDVVNKLTEWILKKTKMADKYYRACGIIVAFFVQNCEVFYEITE